MIVDLYIILFGIVAIVAYFIRCLFIDGSNNKKQIETAKAQREFEEKFIDINLEKEVVARIADWHQFQAIYDEVESDLIEIFGEDYMKQFRINPDKAKGYPLFIPRDQYANFWMKQLLLSKKGKFTTDRSLFLGFGDVAYTNLKMCQVIQRNIRQFDSSFALCKESSYSTGHKPINSPCAKHVIPVCYFSSPFQHADINDYLI